MPDIRIHRAHRLGLARARQVAWSWAEQVERDFDLACTVREGEAGDTVEFQRTGVSGRLLVAADHFDLEARLGFLLGAFSRTIEAEITKNLDALLAAETAPAAAAAAAPSARKTAPGGAKARAQASAAAAPPKPRKTPPARR
ncbi:MAG: polyhydroxyalkanoic acid system family protein [Burkholderiales bacterium]|nr:polyhydroxyalkanoic acid system family protein [Burkholderiales bacterium]